MYSSTTKSIAVKAFPAYLSEQSLPEDSLFLWSYDIQISNQGKKTVQLLRRHWRVIDENGKVTEVDGSGVVGLQPILRPGEAFSYTSGTHLETPSGIMLGTYKMVDEEGKIFDVEIPAFSLDTPNANKKMN
jgi:ApaG protein